jgi:hydroxymethylbilane synthase
VLAAAGLERLVLAECVTEWFDPQVFIPAVAQGALAVEVRAEDRSMIDLVARLNDLDTATAVRAERAFLASVGGSCTLPVGAYATIVGGDLHIRGIIGALGGRTVRGEYSAPASDPERAGSALAEELLSNGGRELVEAGEVISQ